MKCQLLGVFAMIFCGGSIASAQLMDLNCMVETRKQANELLAAFRSEGSETAPAAYGEIQKWSQDVEREGHEMHERLAERHRALSARVENDPAVQAATLQLQALSLNASSADEARRFAEARQQLERQRIETSTRLFYRDDRALDLVRDALVKQGDWNHTEVVLKGKLYDGSMPRSAIEKHERTAIDAFSASNRTVPLGDAARGTIGVLAAMEQVMRSGQLGDHAAVLSSRVRQGFDTGIAPVVVLMKAADLNELHGDMAVHHVQQVAPPPDVRRAAVQQPTTPAGEMMRTAMQEGAVGLQRLAVAEVARKEITRIIREVPPPPASASVTESEGNTWASSVVETLKQTAVEVTKKPVWKIIIK